MTDGRAPGRSTVVPFVMVKDADRVLRFAQDVFGARLLQAPLRRSDGSVWNAELTIGDSTIMVAEATSDDMTRPAFLYVYVADVDAVFAKAQEHGGAAVMAPEARFYGARDGGVIDPCGNWWWIGTHMEDVAEDELARRAAEEEARRAGAGA